MKYFIASSMAGVAALLVALVVGVVVHKRRATPQDAKGHFVNSPTSTKLATGAAANDELESGNFTLRRSQAQGGSTDEFNATTAAIEQTAAAGAGGEADAGFALTNRALENAAYDVQLTSPSGRRFSGELSVPSSPTYAECDAPDSVFAPAKGSTGGAVSANSSKRSSFYSDEASTMRPKSVRRINPLVGAGDQPQPVGRQDSYGAALGNEDMDGQDQDMYAVIAEPTAAVANPTSPEPAPASAGAETTTGV